jgi:hypothetical protein
LEQGESAVELGAGINNISLTHAVDIPFTLGMVRHVEKKLHCEYALVHCIVRGGVELGTILYVTSLGKLA